MGWCTKKPTKTYCITISLRQYSDFSFPLNNVNGPLKHIGCTSPQRAKAPRAHKFLVSTTNIVTARGMVNLLNGFCYLERARRLSCEAPDVTAYTLVRLWGQICSQIQESRLGYVNKCHHIKKNIDAQAWKCYENLPSYLSAVYSKSIPSTKKKTQKSDTTIKLFVDYF